MLTDFKQGLDDLVRYHLDRYPRLELVDLYKCCYQGVLGIEHLFANIDTVYRHLVAEWETLGPCGDDEIIFDPVSIDGHTIRLHLRAYLSRGGTLDPLWRAMLRSFHPIEAGDLAVLDRILATLESGCESGLYPFDPRDIAHYRQHNRQNGFTAVHHSKPFKRYYRPAYRVLTRESLDESMNGMLTTGTNTFP